MGSGEKGAARKMRRTKNLGSLSTVQHRADLCELVAGVTTVTGGAGGWVVFRFGLGRGREASSSMEQRMHKRESERVQKKLFVAMDGWLRMDTAQSKRTRKGSLAPLTARRPLFRSVCAIHVIFCLRNGEGITPVERMTTVRDGITSNYRLSVVFSSSMAADQASVGQQIIARDGIFHCRCSSSVLSYAVKALCERVS